MPFTGCLLNWKIIKTIGHSLTAARSKYGQVKGNSKGYCIFLLVSYTTPSCLNPQSQPPFFSYEGRRCYLRKLIGQRSIIKNIHHDMLSCYPNMINYHRDRSFHCRFVGLCLLKVTCVVFPTFYLKSFFNRNLFFWRLSAFDLLFNFSTWLLPINQWLKYIHKALERSRERGSTSKSVNSTTR